MIEILAYKCNFCNKIYRHKSSAKRHENKCFANPKLKACRTCKHFKIGYNTIYVRPTLGESYGDSDYDVKYNYCDLKKGEFGEDYPFTNNCRDYKYEKDNFAN